MRETAERRMFSKKIVESDVFLDMPLSTQALYFHLSMEADDDGFVNNPRKIQRMLGASDDDLKLLLAKNFLISFESGVVVVKHWKMNNYIQKDRYHKTIYIEEKKVLNVEENGSYSVKNGFYPECIQSMDTSCMQNGYKMDTEVSLGKVSKGKDSLGEVSIGKDSINTSVEPPEPKERIHYQEIAYMYNSICVSLPKLQTFSDGRKKSVKRIIDKYGIDTLRKCFEMAEESDFLSGRKTNWKASFDWLIKPANFVKVIDGNYLNEKKQQPSLDDNFRLPGGQIDWDAFGEWANEVDREIEERRKQSDS